MGRGRKGSFLKKRTKKLLSVTDGTGPTYLALLLQVKTTAVFFRSLHPLPGPAA